MSWQQEQMVGVLDCNKHDAVDQFPTELKRRMMNRGDTRNIRRIEAALAGRVADFAWRNWWNQVQHH